jgi:uncharacterized protein YlxW (UPF0749 family)
MEEEIKQLQDKVIELEQKIKGLENDLDVLYQTDNRRLARAIHEIQEHLRKEGMYIINDIYAPTMVGMS